MLKFKDIILSTILAITPLQLNANPSMAPIISYLLSGSSDTIDPVFTMSTTRNVNEKQMSAIILKASDSSSVKYSISGGDSASFDVDSLTGVVTFNITTDYDTKKVYTFTAKAIDTSLNETTQTIIINILNIDDSAIKYAKMDVDSDGHIDFITARYYDTSNRLIRETRSVYGAKPEIMKEYTYVDDILVDKKEIYGNSGILHYYYNDNGVIQNVYLETFDNRTIEIATYTYEDDLLMSHVYTRDYTGSDYAQYYKKSYSYNADKKVVTMEKVNLTSDSFMYSIDKTYSNSLLTKEIYISPGYTYTFLYSADNTLTSYMMEGGGQLQKDTRGTKKSYSYSIANLLRSISSSDFDDDKTINLGRYEKREIFAIDSGSLIQKTLYTYNNSGNYLSIDSYDGEGALTYSNQYTYNEYNDLIIHENYSHGELNFTTTYANTYVDDKLFSTLTTKDNTITFYKEFDENGRIILNENFNEGWSFGNWNKYNFYNPSVSVKYQKATFNYTNNLFLITSNMCDIDGDDTMDINIDYTWNNAGKITQVRQTDNYLNKENIRIKNYQYNSYDFLRKFELINDNNMYYYKDYTIYYESTDLATEYEFSKISPNNEYVTLLTTYDYETAKDILQQRFIYDNQDRLIKTISYKDLEIDTVVDITFNEENQVVRKYTHSGKSYNESIYEINSTYNDDNTIHSEIHTINDNSQGINTVNTYSYLYRYTDSTKEVTIRIDEGSNGSTDKTLSNVYDLDNKLLSEESEYANGYTYNYEYDAQGKLTTKTFDQDDGDYSQVMELYTYDGDYLQKALYYSWSDSYDSVTYVYDSNNRLIQTLNDTDNDGSIQSVVNYYYVK